MNDAFYIGATGLHAQQAALEVVSNNIANINTAAYKRATVQFAELVADPNAQRRRPQAASGAAAGPDTQPPMFGVAVGATPRVFTQGGLTKSSNPLDLAIQGDGFLEVLGPGGQTLLWRGGTLQVNADGYLAASNGLPLKGMISVPHDANGLTVSETGLVTATVGGQQNPETLGQLELTSISQPSLLMPTSDGLYQLPDDKGEVTRGQPGQDNLGTLSVGFTEASNVNLTDEMVTLLIMQRAYAANAKVVQAGDDLMDIVNGLKR